MIEKKNIKEIKKKGKKILRNKNVMYIRVVFIFKYGFNSFFGHFYADIEQSKKVTEEPSVVSNGISEDIILQNRLKLAMKKNSPSAKKIKQYEPRLFN